MSKYASYTHKKLLEAIAEDAAACETAQDIIKLRNELLNDPDLSVKEIVTACLIGAVMNKSALEACERRNRATANTMPWYKSIFFK